MLNLNSVMIGSSQPQVLADFYQKVLEKPADMVEGDWHGWSVGSSFLSVGSHSDMQAASTEPGRIMFNFETDQVQSEFERIKSLGAKVVAAPYEMGGMWIATFADPDNNYFQLMSPWKQ